MAQAPEFKLDKDDAKMLGDAVAGVLAFHKIKMTPKQEAYGILIEAAAQVYPPMFVSMYVRMQNDAKNKPKGPPQPPRPSATVSPIRPVPQEAPSPVAGATFDPFKITIPD